jgi:hypothetical protein
MRVTVERDYYLRTGNKAGTDIKLPIQVLQYLNVAISRSSEKL